MSFEICVNGAHLRRATATISPHSCLEHRFGSMKGITPRLDEPVVTSAGGKAATSRPSKVDGKRAGSARDIGHCDTASQFTGEPSASRCRAGHGKGHSRQSSTPAPRRAQDRTTATRVGSEIATLPANYRASSRAHRLPASPTGRREHLNPGRHQISHTLRDRLRAKPRCCRCSWATNSGPRVRLGQLVGIEWVPLHFRSDSKCRQWRTTP